MVKFAKTKEPENGQDTGRIQQNEWREKHHPASGEL
jgi:hypothetical protein